MGVPSHSDGKTLRSNADRVGGDVSPESREHKSIAETKRGGLGLQLAEQWALADQKEARV